MSVIVLLLFVIAGLVLLTAWPQGVLSLIRLFMAALVGLVVLPVVAGAGYAVWVALDAARGHAFDPVVLTVVAVAVAAWLLVRWDYRRVSR